MSAPKKANDKKVKPRKKKAKNTTSKYDEKIVVDASFEELIKELLKPNSK